ncbi:MAG: GntR family transcriptional regulator [Deinococcales bacterium]
MEYGIATGEIPRGTRLPSVRELAGALGSSPATVAQVYKELGEQGLVESRRGHGTFVPERLPPSEGLESMVALRRAVDALFESAEQLGVSRAAAAEAVALRASQPVRAAAGLRLLFVGVYDDASEGYAAAIRGALSADDAIEWTTFERLRRTARPPHGIDVFLTIANREAELRRLVGGAAPVVSLTFIPSRETRTRLAQLPADARVLAVSDVPQFLPTLQRAVARFAPHLADVAGGLSDSPGLEHQLRSCTTVVYGTGTTGVLGRVPPEVDAFEFRFEPDAHSIAALLLPTLESVRSGRAHEETP